MKSRIIWGLALLVTAGLVVGWVGCGRSTQLDAKNRRLLESLKTAIMSRNTDWLDKNEALIEARHSEGTLSDAEHEALQAIVRAARADDWTTAQQEVMSLAKGQSSAP